MSKPHLKTKGENSNYNAGAGIVGNNFNIDTLIPKKEVVEKKRVLLGVNLEKELADKVKCAAIEKNYTVTEILEVAIAQMFGNTIINEKALAKYNSKYKKKNKKKNKNKKSEVDIDTENNSNE